MEPIDLPYDTTEWPIGSPVLIPGLLDDNSLPTCFNYEEEIRDPITKIQAEIHKADNQKKNLLIDNVVRLANSLCPPPETTTQVYTRDENPSKEAFISYNISDQISVPPILPITSSQDDTIPTNIDPTLFRSVSADSISMFEPQTPPYPGCSEKISPRGTKRDQSLHSPPDLPNTITLSIRKKRTRCKNLDAGFALSHDPLVSGDVDNNNNVFSSRATIPPTTEISFPDLRYPQEQSTLQDQELTQRRTISRTALTMTSAKDFGTIDFAATTAIDAAQLAILREQYHTRLLTQTKSKKKSTARLFTSIQAAQLTGYFFEEVQGPRGLKHVADFVDHYPVSQVDRPTRSISLALQNSGDMTLPEYVRDFFAAWDARERCADEGTPATRHIYDVCYSRIILTQYEIISTAARDKDALLTECCSKYNVHTSSGHGTTSLALDLLTTLGGFRRSVLSRYLERGKRFSIVGEKLGAAFFLLTPPKSNTLLEKMSMDCIRVGCDVLLELCPYMKGVVRLLDQWIFQPITMEALALEVDTEALATEGRGQTFFDALRQATDINITEKNYMDSSYSVG